MRCLICMNKIENEISFLSIIYSKKICEACVNKFEYSNCKHSMFIYNDIARLVLNQIKKNNDLILLQALSEIIDKSKLKKAKKYLYCPVPLHPKREIKRTFNQSEEIIRIFNLKATNLLERTDELVQSEKTQLERKTNPPEFNVINYKKTRNSVILVDDLYTTGSTIKSTKNKLESNGYSNVTYFTLFKVKNNGGEKIEE